MADGGDRIQKGSVLFLQNETPQYIYMLQSGSMEVLSASREYNGLDKSIILSKSIRVGMIKDKTLIAGFSDLLTSPFKKTVRAMEDSVISKYPIKTGGYKAITSSDPAQAISILRHLYNSLKSAMGDEGRYLGLYRNLRILGDNLGLIYSFLSMKGASGKIHSASAELSGNFKKSGGSMPSQIEAKFLIQDNSRYLNSNYEFPQGSMVGAIDKSNYDFIIKFLKMEPSVFKTVIQADQSIAVHMFETLTSAYSNCFERVETIYNFISEELSKLYGLRDSWVSYLVDGHGGEDWNDSGRLSPNFFQQFQGLTAKIASVHTDLYGKDPADALPGIGKLALIKSGGKTPLQPVRGETETAHRSPGIISGGNMGRSMHQIFEFAIADKEFQNRFLKMMNDFKRMKDPFDTEIEGRKVRRHITKMYWDLYKQVYLRSKTESTLPKPAYLMLMYGFLDEELLERDQINELNDLARVKERTGNIKVVVENEFLSRIHAGEEDPSITEMGLTYQAFLLEQEKHSKKKEDDRDDIKDENVKKALFEIEQRVASACAVCSGSTATAFPILNSRALGGSLKPLFTTKHKIETIVNGLRDVDYSVFYRETVLKMGEAREIIQEEITPYFILLPVYGTKTMLWQELTGINKRSRGRIVIPIFFMGDLTRMLAHSFACFRWELNRTIKGAMWGDPIEGGVTGEYFDYVNTYKKMSKLSQEAKERITERFRSLRTNRDRFADDYIQWVLFEKDGIMKQNSVVREMFFKHIPFRKDTRDKLENMPAFTQAANRYKNVNKRIVEASERKFKKYQDEQGNFPDKIQKYIEFLKI
ncbi:MAG: cyclic nucleotide-binding domain-containing protein [Spirochaetes bacterium]|jgi:CRP-like cAMP-binding protein|nr:cyclic nucleotide-binding domain-containing protein [Spirochaetota bacterium]